MNKLNKFKTQETACYTFISMWVIGIIILMVTSSCSTANELSKTHHKDYPCYFTK